MIILLIMGNKWLRIILNWELWEFLSENEKVVVIFFTDTCSKCHMWMDNLIDLYEWEEDPLVVAYNIWEDKELAEKLNLTSVPMLFAFENWVELGRIDEVQTNDFIKNYFKRNEWNNLLGWVQEEELTEEATPSEKDEAF